MTFTLVTCAVYLMCIPKSSTTLSKLHSELCYYGVRHDDLLYSNILQVAEHQKGNDEEAGAIKSPVHGLQYDYRIIDLEWAILTWKTSAAMEGAVAGRIEMIVYEIAGYS